MKDEVKLGIFGVVAFGLFFATVIWVGKCTATRGSVPYRVQFDDLNDLKEGALVKFAGGLSIGYVKQVYREGTKAEILLWVEENFPLTKNSGFVIRSAGMLGEKYVQLNYKDGPKAPPNHLFAGSNAASISSALLSVQLTLQEIKKMVRTLNAIFGSGDSQIIRNTSNTLAGIMQKLNIILSNSNDNISGTFKNISQVTEGLKNIVVNLNSIVNDFKTGSGTLNILLKDKKMGQDLKDLVKSLKEAADKLNKSSILNETKKKPRW